VKRGATSAARDTPAERLGRLRAVMRETISAQPLHAPPPPLRSAPPDPGDGLEHRGRPGARSSAVGAPLAIRIERLAAGVRASSRAACVHHETEGATDGFADDQRLAARLGGRVHAPGVLEFVHEHRLPALDVPCATELGWLGLGEPGPQATDLCFIDTETSGLAGGCGTVPFLIGIARLRGRSLHIRQWLLTGFAGEREMLRALLGQVADTAVWVSYNGKSFDLPLLATRLALVRLEPLPTSRPHADLLHAVRSAYGRRWPDCRLATAEACLLGRTREHDLPGHAVPAAWTRFLRERDARALPAVLLHNRLDLAALAELLPVLGALYEPGPHRGRATVPRALPQADHGAIARALLRRGQTRLAIRHLEAARERLDDRERLLLADLLRRSGRLPEALALWTDLAARSRAPALVALLRHERAAPARALHWAARLCALEPHEPRHRQRMERLAQAATAAGSLSLPGLEDAVKK